MRKMSQAPHELIQQVQISTRAAAGLSDYNPTDPTLPALPPLSAAIAASNPSLPDLRCKNCKGKLLRGSESIICLYCGRGPHYDVAPDPICFISTIGYQWLLRSLRLNGSEMVDQTIKGEQDQGQSSPKALTPLSDYLNFKIPWPSESEKEETSFEDRFLEDSKRRFLSLTGVAPDKFFLKSNKNGPSDTSFEQQFMHNQIGTEGGKDDADINNQNLLKNVQSSKAADSFSKHKTDDAFSGWEADFQFADSENQHVGYKSDHFVGSSADSGFKFQDSKSCDNSKGLEVDLSAHLDSVFGPQMNAAKPKDDPAVSPALDDWNSDDLWNNLSSAASNSAGVLDSTFTRKDDNKGNHVLDHSKDLSTSVDLFQDFQLQTKYTNVTENKTTNEEPKTVDEDSFDEWNDFAGSASLEVPPQNAWTGSDYQVSTSDQKSSEIDLFSFVDNKFDRGDFGSFSQPDPFFTSTNNSNPPADVNAILQNPASDWFNDSSGPSQESGQAANNEDTSEKSTNDEVKKLISQMHDLSFMLETDLRIPSTSDTHNSPPKD